MVEAFGYEDNTLGQEVQCLAPTCLLHVLQVKCAMGSPYYSHYNPCMTIQFLLLPQHKHNTIISYALWLLYGWGV